MSVITVARKGTVKGDESKQHSGFMTTTELAKLCGVSRFTIINWVKQGRIKVIRTAGGHSRIPVSEALSLLRTFGKNGKPSPSEVKELPRQEMQTTDGGKECGNCLTDNKKNNRVKPKKKNILHAFGYGVGCGVHIFKERIVK